MMRRVAAETRAEIKRLKDHADALRTLIQKLKAEPEPDEAKIKLLQPTLKLSRNRSRTTRHRSGTSKMSVATTAEHEVNRCAGARLRQARAPRDAPP